MYKRKAVAAALFFVVLPGIGFFLAKLIRAKKEQIGLYTFMNAYSNVGFMGFPVIEGLCGSVGLFYAAIFNLIFNLSTYTLGIWMMNKGREDAEKFNVKRLLSPGVLLSALSIVIYFLDIKFPTVITETIESIGSITSVSYTHLDVYKRQPVACRDRCCIYPESRVIL